MNLDPLTTDGFMNLGLAIVLAGGCVGAFGEALMRRGWRRTGKTVRGVAMVGMLGAFFGYIPAVLFWHDYGPRLTAALGY